jgi:hypothetical protein
VEVSEGLKGTETLATTNLNQLSTGAGVNAGGGDGRSGGGRGDRGQGGGK